MSKTTNRNRIPQLQPTSHANWDFKSQSALKSVYFGLYVCQNYKSAGKFEIYGKITVFSISTK